MGHLNDQKKWRRTLKKKFVLLIFSIHSIILLAGCGNKEYDEAMKQEKEVIEEGDFEEAATDFKEALEKKSDDKAESTYLKQTENMIDGLNFLNDGELDESEKSLESVKQEEDGSGILVKKANAILKEGVFLKETNEEIGNSLSDAKLHVDEEYAEALTILEGIQQKDLTHSYFKSVNNLNDK